MTDRPTEVFDMVYFPELRPGNVFIDQEGHVLRAVGHPENLTVRYDDWRIRAISAWPLDSNEVVEVEVARGEDTLVPVLDLASLVRIKDLESVRASAHDLSTLIEYEVGDVSPEAALLARDVEFLNLKAVRP